MAGATAGILLFAWLCLAGMCIEAKAPRQPPAAAERGRRGMGGLTWVNGIALRPQLLGREVRLRGGGEDASGGSGEWGDQSCEDEEMDDDEKIAKEAEMQAGMRLEAMGNPDMGATVNIQTAREITEETPEGWDPDADWELRITEREWFKERREHKFVMGLEDLNTRYFHAIRYGAVPWVREMLSGEGDWGGKVDVGQVEEEERKWTGLHIASARGNVGVARLLLERGADVMCLTTEGCSPLHMAATYGRTSTCAALLEAGANVNQVDAGEDTPVDLCVGYKRQETAKFLLSVGAKSSKQPIDELEARAEWVVDPLWPEGYKKDLLADDDDHSDDISEQTSELERQIYACGSNVTYVERMAQAAEVAEEWVTEPDNDPPDRDLEMGPDDGLLPDGVGVNADSSSGWDPRVMASRRNYVSDPENWSGPSNDDEFGNLLKAPDWDITGGVNANEATMGGGNGDDVSTNEGDTDGDAEVKDQVTAAHERAAADEAAKPKKDGEDDSVSMSDWSHSEEGNPAPRKETAKSQAHQKRETPKKKAAKKDGERVSVSVSDWSESG